MKNSFGRALVLRLLDSLNDHGQFDQWWDGIDDDARTQIIQRLTDIVNDTMAG